MTEEDLQEFEKSKRSFYYWYENEQVKKIGLKKAGSKMTLEEFKEEIENKYKSQIAGLMQQIENSDYIIKTLKQEIEKLKKYGWNFLENAAEFKKSLSEFMEDNSYKLPDLDCDFDDTVRLFKKERR